MYANTYNGKRHLLSENVIFQEKKQEEVRFINFKLFKVFLTQIFYSIPIILIVKDNLSSAFFL